MWSVKVFLDLIECYRPINENKRSKTFMSIYVQTFTSPIELAA